MANPGLAKTYNAAADIAAYTLMKPGANDYDVLPATGSADAIFGCNSEIAAKSGNPADVYHKGIVNVKLGGTVTRGDWITSDANGNGVTAAPAAGVNANVLGRAVISGVAGDVIPVLTSLARIQG